MGKLIHIVAGSKDWAPTEKELIDLAQLFRASIDDSEKTGFGIVATRDHVSVQVFDIPFNTNVEVVVEKKA